MKSKLTFEFEDIPERDRFLMLITFGYELISEIDDFAQYLRRLDKYEMKETIEISEVRETFYNMIESLDKFRD